MIFNYYIKNIYYEKLIDFITESSNKVRMASKQKDEIAAVNSKDEAILCSFIKGESDTDILRLFFDSHSHLYIAREEWGGVKLLFNRTKRTTSYPEELDWRYPDATLEIKDYQKKSDSELAAIVYDFINDRLEWLTY